MRPYILLALALVACKPSAEKEKGSSTTAASATLATLPAALGPFTSVRAGGPVDVDVTVGKPQAVAVACSDGPSNRVGTTVEDGGLVIAATEGSHCKVTISVPQLEAIDASTSGNFAVHGKAMLETVVANGSGNLDIESTETDAITLKSSGSGALHVRAMTVKTAKLSALGSGGVVLAGKAGSLDAKIVGSGSVTAKELVAESVKLDITGSGSAVVDATKKVDVNVVGQGSAKILGNPAEKTKKVVGSGSVSFE